MVIRPGAALVRFRAFLRRHRALAAVLCAAVALRVVTEIGYRWAIWFNDSFDYVALALHPRPDPVRSGGYPLLLWLLRPFHSMALVTAVQHLLALGAAVLLYALLRRRFGLPGWGAALAVVPLLLDAYQIQLEQLLLGDTLAEFLLVAAAVVLLWWLPEGRRARSDQPGGADQPGQSGQSDRSGRSGRSVRPARPARSARRRLSARRAVPAAGAAGLLFAAAALTRAVALPLAVVGLGYLLIARAGWRVITAAAVAAVAPLAGYALWFHSAHGTYALDSADGVFLWARTAAFAECGKIHPPPSEAWLCPRLPPDRRAASSSQVWKPDSPLDWGRGQVFSAAENATARRFALRAIAAQPGDYARTVVASAGRTFGWSRAPYPTAYTAHLYTFSGTRARLPSWPVTVEAGTGKAVTTTQAVARSYAGGDPATGIVRPYSTVMRGYQRYAYLRGTLLGIIMLTTPVALAAALSRDRRRARGGTRPGGDRRLSGPAWFYWAIAVTLIVIPPMTVDFDYRYVLPAVPFGCTAAALALGRFLAGPARRSPGSPATDTIQAVPELTITDD